MGRRKYPPAGFSEAMRNRERAYRQREAEGGCMVTLVFFVGLAWLVWKVAC